MKVTFIQWEMLGMNAVKNYLFFVLVEKVSNNNHSIVMFFVWLSFMICKKYSLSHTHHSQTRVS